MSMASPVHVIGGGLAGCEAAWQLASRGIPVVLWEMRPAGRTPAHETGDLAELVCSNTLGSRMPHTAPGIFKRELACLGSLVVTAGEAASVPAGGALAVDRQRFSAGITAALDGLPDLEIRRQEVDRLPPADQRTLIATGPLTSPALTAALGELLGEDDLYFYDAIAPIVDASTVDMDVAWRADRYGEAGTGDYLNLPLDQPTYEAFVDALLEADALRPRPFEEERFFAGCQPIEAIASKGRESLRFGPMKPVGLRNPRTGHRAWAVVQLRQETRAGGALNIVGFQTRLRYGEQARVLRMIPGLQQAEFLRLGSVHRNTFINTPRLLDRGLRHRAAPHLSFAGQVVGCEGYTESSAMGLWAALSVVAEREGRDLPPPPKLTMLGGLLEHLATADPASFQPMNVNFGLLPPDPQRVARKRKKERRIERGRDCVELLEAWADEHGVGRPGPELKLP